MTLEIWIFLVDPDVGSVYWLLVMKRVLSDGMKTPASWAKGYSLFSRIISSSGEDPRIVLKLSSCVANEDEFAVVVASSICGNSHLRPILRSRFVSYRIELVQSEVGRGGLRESPAIFLSHWRPLVGYSLFIHAHHVTRKSGSNVSTILLVWAAQISCPTNCATSPIKGRRYLHCLLRQMPTKPPIASLRLLRSNALQRYPAFRWWQKFVASYPRRQKRGVVLRYYLPARVKGQ